MFTTDSRTENFLIQLGVQFEYRNGLRLPDEFAIGWDTENIGRPVAIREEAVIEYATLMEAGSAAPAPIICETSKGFRVLDGVQRLSAAQLQQSTRISAYVVKTDSEDSLATIRVLANARMQGRAEPAEWTRRRAIEVLVIGRGMSHAEVAKMGGWKPSDVKRIAEAIELQTRIMNAGGPDFPDAMLTELRPFLETNELLEKAVIPITAFMQTIKQAKFSASDATDYIADFFAVLPKGANPHQVYKSRLETIHEDPEIISRTTGRQSTEVPKDVVLLRTLRMAETVSQQILTHGGKVTNVDEFFRLIDRITKTLKSIAPNQKPNTARVPADLWSKNQ